jgi:hypothetical protein
LRIKEQETRLIRHEHDDYDDDDDDNDNDDDDDDDDCPVFLMCDLASQYMLCH